MSAKNITANNTISLDGVVGGTTRWNGGRGTIEVAGVPDGATVTLQADIDEIGMVDVSSNTTFADTEGFGAFDLAEADMQLVIAGGGGSLNLSIAVKKNKG